MIETWVLGLTDDRVWQPERDIPRIRKAFARAITACDAWPSPKRFLDLLPPSEQKALPHVPTVKDPAKVEAIIGELATELRKPPVMREPEPEREKPDLAAAEEALRQHYADRKTLATGDA